MFIYPFLRDYFSCYAVYSHEYELITSLKNDHYQKAESTSNRPWNESHYHWQLGLSALRRHFSSPLLLSLQI